MPGADSRCRTGPGHGLALDLQDQPQHAVVDGCWGPMLTTMRSPGLALTGGRDDLVPVLTAQDDHAVAFVDDVFAHQW